jgi:hypothetical protein
MKAIYTVLNNKIYRIDQDTSEPKILVPMPTKEHSVVNSDTTLKKVTATVFLNTMETTNIKSNKELYNMMKNTIERQKITEITDIYDRYMLLIDYQLFDSKCEICHNVVTKPASAQDAAILLGVAANNELCYRRVKQFDPIIEFAVANQLPLGIMKTADSEYHFKINDTVDKYIDKFENIPIAEPLLISDEDFEDLIASITSKGDYDDDTAVVFMGHGSPAESNMVYTKLQGMLKDKGFDNYYIGTVEAKPDYDDVLAMVKEGDYKKIVLKPLMVVAGDHAQNDMAGDEDDSWKSMFASEGYEVECVIEGLAQSKDIRDVYIKHVQNAIDGLN